MMSHGAKPLPAWTGGAQQSVYIVAELSANHKQRFDEAVSLLRAAKECGADAVKLQTYTADTITLAHTGPNFRIGGGTLWDGRTLHDLYSEAYMPWDWQPKLNDLAREVGLDLFSTPFDHTAVDFLEAMNVAAYKIASFELVDTGLLQYVARTGKPVILSTGMATLAEIGEAVETLRLGGCSEVALLKCTSAYPAPAEEANLRTIPHLAEAFGCTVGLSDHTLGIAVPVAAVALGARIIEKHFTLSRSVPGPDAAFSLEPAEFKAMVEAIRVTEKALGQVHYGTSEHDITSRGFRRSLFVVANVRAGELFSEANVRSIRPGQGLPPKYLPLILGRRATQDLPAGTPMNWSYVQS